MSKSTETIGSTITEEVKDQNTKYNLNKFDYDLYHEEDDLTEKIIRVKRINLPNKCERWKIFEDTKVVFTIEGTKLSKKEKDFLRTPDGFNFLISQHKSGIKSFNSLRAVMKNHIK